MKVKHTFYCTQERKKYLRGDKYTGKRTDLGHLLEGKKEEKTVIEDKILKFDIDTKAVQKEVKPKRGRPKKI